MGSHFSYRLLFHMSPSLVHSQPTRAMEAGDLAGGNASQGWKYTASAKRFRKWWPKSYADKHVLPSGLEFPVIWHCKSIEFVGGSCVEDWTWEWNPAPGLPSVEEAETALASHAAARPGMSEQDESGPAAPASCS